MEDGLKKNIKPISTKNKNYFEKVRIFKNVKYKWGEISLLKE